MPCKKVLITTRDYKTIDDVMDSLSKTYTYSTISISRVRIENNRYELVLNINAEVDDIVKAVSFLRQTPSLRAEEI